MSSLPLSLFRLEEIDSSIESALATTESLRARIQGDPEIVSAQRRVADLEKRQAAADGRQRSLEGVVEDASATVERLTKTLYGGAIHDSREMASVQHEIEHAGARRTGAEDELLEAMDAAEKLQSELDEARRRASSLSERRAGSLGTMKDDLNRLSADIEVMRNERAGMADAIDKSQLDRYERLRARLRHAVSHVQNDICQWCRVQIPHADVQHARSGELVTCTNCSRILYVDEST